MIRMPGPDGQLLYVSMSDRGLFAEIMRIHCRILARRLVWEIRLAADVDYWRKEKVRTYNEKRRRPC